MITAVILAAGTGSRMGRLKQLLPWGESTVLETVITKVSSCPLIDDQIRVVLGAGYQQIEAVLGGITDPRLQILINYNYRRGMLTSIRKGLAGLPDQTEYVMFFLADQPLISSEVIESLAGEIRKRSPGIMVPV